MACCGFGIAASLLHRNVWSLRAAERILHAWDALRNFDVDCSCPLGDDPGRSSLRAGMLPGAGPQCGAGCRGDRT